MTQQEFKQLTAGKKIYLVVSKTPVKITANEFWTIHQHTSKPNVDDRICLCSEGKDYLTFKIMTTKQIDAICETSNTSQSVNM